MTRHRVLLRLRPVEAVVGAGAIAVAAAGVALLVVLSGGGAQPEDVLPADAVAFAKVDLDPAAEQKLAVYELARRLPGSGVGDDVDDLRDDLLRTLLQRLGVQDDLQPGSWLGARAGVALLPAEAGEDRPAVVVALQHTGRDAATEALAGLDPGVVRHAFAPDEDYVLLSDSPAALARAAEADAHLAADAGFQRSVEDLEGGQVVLAWGDLAGLAADLPSGARRAVAAAFGADDPAGSVVVGARAVDGVVEVQGRASGLPSAMTDLLAGAGTTGLVQDLPAGTSVGLGASGAGPLAARVLSTALTPTALGLLAVRASGEGLDLPDDLTPLLGADSALAVLGRGDVAVRSRGGGAEAEQAARSAARVLTGGDAGLVAPGDGTLAAGLTPWAVAAIADPAGRLGDRSDVRRLLPDADAASLLLWLDTGRLAADHPELADLDRLDGVGATWSPGGGLRVRLGVG